MHFLRYFRSSYAFQTSWLFLNSIWEDFPKFWGKSLDYKAAVQLPENSYRRKRAKTVQSLDIWGGVIPLFLEGFDWNLACRTRIWYYNITLLKNVKNFLYIPFVAYFWAKNEKNGFSKFRSCWVSKTRQFEVLHLFLNSFWIDALFKDHFWAFLTKKSPSCITCVMFRHENLISCLQCS